MRGRYRLQRGRRPTGSPTERTLLLVEPSTNAFLVVPSPRRPWACVLARLKAATLDSQLRAGLAPDESELRSIRAEMLVSPNFRLTLADEWEHILTVADHAARRPGTRALLACDPIAAVDDEIHELVALLRRCAPVPPRGVAMAHLLLTEGGGPLYRVRPDGVPLQHAVAATIYHLLNE